MQQDRDARTPMSKTYSRIYKATTLQGGQLAGSVEMLMNWFNYGEWDVDHVLPCASFDLTDEDEQKTCFVHSNLQPLWASENQSKGCRY